MRSSVVHFRQYRVYEARLAVRSPDDPIRVVYCIDNMQIGGTELNALRTAERLDRRKFSVSVVCIRDNGPLLARYKDAGIPVHTFPMKSLLGLEAMQQAVRLIRLLRTERAEIVHSHDAYTSVFGTICARLAGVRGVRAEPTGILVQVTELHRAVPALLDELRRQGVALTELRTHSATLEDVFVGLTGRHLRDQ